jgi:hypothetical protein
VSICPAEPAAFSGNQSIQSVIAMPMREASTPRPIIRATGCFSPAIRGSVSGGPLASSS